MHDENLSDKRNVPKQLQNLSGSMKLFQKCSLKLQLQSLTRFGNIQLQKRRKKKKQTTGTPIPRTEKRPCHLDGIPQVLRLNHQINRELQTVHWYQRKLFLAAVSPTAVCPWRCVAKTQVSTQCRPTSLGIQVKPEPCQENNSYSHLRDTSVCRNGNGRSAFYSIKKSTRGG